MIVVRPVRRARARGRGRCGHDASRMDVFNASGTAGATARIGESLDRPAPTRPTRARRRR